MRLSGGFLRPVDQRGFSTTGNVTAATIRALSGLQVTGKLAWGPAITITSADSPYNYAATSPLHVDSTGGAVIVNLPKLDAALGDRFAEIVKAVAANTVTVNRNTTDVIGFAGAASKVLNAQDERFLAHGAVDAAGVGVGVWKE